VKQSVAGFSTALKEVIEMEDKKDLLRITSQDSTGKNGFRSPSQNSREIPGYAAYSTAQLRAMWK
jgi:hypothetical protein